MPLTRLSSISHHLSVLSTMPQNIARIILVSICLLASLAQAQIAIHPFESQDTYTGLAISEQVQRILEQAAPENTPVWSLIETRFLKPPLGIRQGYLSPSTDLSGGVSNPSGAQVLQETLGVDVVITGSISGANIVQYDEESNDNDSFTLDVYINDGGISEHFSFAGKLSALADTSYRVSKLFYERYGWRVHPLAKDNNDTSFNDHRAYRDYLQILAALDSGFMLEAHDLLEQFLTENLDNYPQAARLDRALRAIQENRYGEEPSLSAAFASGMQELQEANQHIAYFEAASQASDLPLYDLWLGILRDEQNDRAGATEAFAAASRYPFGAASEAVYLSKHQLEGAEASLEAASSSAELSVLWALSLASQALGNLEQEKALLEQLKQLYADNPYSYQRASFIAFNEEDAVAAAENLAKALELRPESSLYWTNYGWAQYLLGDYEGSIASSLKATELEPNQLIAYYNLGLAYAVENDLEKSLFAYDIAIRLNPVVEPAGLADIEQAVQDFPENASLHFALGNLYELQGNNEGAGVAFERFIELAAETMNTSEAEQRLAQLGAAPAPFTILSETLYLSFAEQAIALDAIHAGDRITPVFHLYTEGFELPKEVIVSYQLAAISLSQQINIPANVVDYRINSIPIDIPRDIPAGEYQLEIRVSSSDTRSSEASLTLNLKEKTSLVRQLVARGIILRNLETWQPYYSLQHIDNAIIDETIIPRLLQELRDTAHVADESLPAIGSGKFAAMSGAEVFEQSTAKDIRHFLHFAATTTGEGIDIAFVEAYAQWVIEGAPAREGD